MKKIIIFFLVRKQVLKRKNLSLFFIMIKILLKRYTLFTIRSVICSTTNVLLILRNINLVRIVLSRKYLTIYGLNNYYK